MMGSIEKIDATTLRDNDIPKCMLSIDTSISLATSTIYLINLIMHSYIVLNSYLFFSLFRYSSFSSSSSLKIKWILLLNPFYLKLVTHCSMWTLNIRHEGEKEKFTLLMRFRMRSWKKRKQRCDLKFLLMMHIFQTFNDLLWSWHIKVEIDSQRRS